MTVQGLLNGKEQLPLLDGLVVEVSAVHESRPSAMELTCWRDGDRQWRTTLQELDADPTSAATSATHADFRAQLWTPHNQLVVAGYAAAHVLDVVDGSVRRRCGLQFIDMSSLDVLDIVPLPAQDVCVVVSTKRVWVLGRPGKDDALRYEPDGLVTRFLGWSKGVLRVAEYDVLDPMCPIVERTIDLKAGAAR